jgi:heterodisulfide reductase subunit C
MTVQGNAVVVDIFDGTNRTRREDGHNDAGDDAQEDTDKKGQNNGPGGKDAKKGKEEEKPQRPTTKKRGKKAGTDAQEGKEEETQPHPRTRRPAEKTAAQEKETKQSPEQFKLIDDSSTCIMCGACYSDCDVLEVDDNFLGPAALAKAQRFVQDSRDGKTLERVKELSKPGGIWDCTHCAECVERCPKPARPFDRIKEIMTVALEEGVTNNKGARHALSFAKSVKSSGRLNENIIPVESVGFFNFKGLFDLLPVGLRMFFKGKNPPILHKSIDEVEDVKRIYMELDE